jgi:hypothetical protein
MTKLEARVPNEARMPGNDELGHSDFNRHSDFGFRAWYDSAFVALSRDSGGGSVAAGNWNGGTSV